MCQICSKHKILGLMPPKPPYHYGPLLRAALALKIFFWYDCDRGWYLCLVSRFEPVLTCSSRDIHVNTQKNQKIPKVYSLVWYHCIVRQIHSAHAQPLLRNNFIATCRKHALEIENQLSLWCLAKTTEPLDTGAAEAKKS